jgi:DNA-binding FadR family transcriptional regulator
MTDRVQGRNLTHEIANDLGIAIATGIYPADHPMPTEAELSQKYDASRTVLREAVKMLTAKGLLSSRPRRGTWVEPETHWNLLDPEVLGWIMERKYSPALLIEFTEIRLAIEPGAAALAARVADDEGRQAIQDAISRMQAADHGDDDPLESDVAFHVAVLRATRNRFYLQLIGLTSTALRFSIQTTNRYKGVQQASVAAHRKVMDGIFAGKPVAAAEAMRKIIQEALDLICKRDALHAARRQRGVTSRQG